MNSVSHRKSLLDCLLAAMAATPLSEKTVDPAVDIQLWPSWTVANWRGERNIDTLFNNSGEIKKAPHEVLFKNQPQLIYFRPLRLDSTLSVVAL